MLMLSTDGTFNFELLRVLGLARYGAADIAEVLDAGGKIAAGDFASWTEVFRTLAENVEASLHGGPAEPTDTSIREVMFRAASYWRTADFFIHGNVDDPRIRQFWAAQTRCFDEAIARLPVPGVRFEVPMEGARVPATFYRASDDAVSRPTLMLFNGFDGSQEEMAHVMGFSALERGINIVTFEGPGQPTVRREQGVGFVAEWEKVVTPLINHVLTLPTVDPKRLGLLGYSYGGYLGPRAAAFEPRLAALVCIDGVFDAYEGFANSLTPVLKQLMEAGDRDGFNAAIGKAVTTDINLRWMVEQGIWAFKKTSAFDFFHTLKPQTLEGIVDQIQCPVFVGHAQHDRFFEGQPEKLAAALGDRATLHRFTDATATGVHCQVGASVELNRAVLDWFLEAVA
jgi:pimeloyl-ACP methyl ester carboxylesterase